MPHDIIWTKKAKKSLKLLDRPIAERVLAKVDSLALQDAVFLERVEGRDFYKLRIGDYRVFIDKFPATNKLVILVVRHRRNAYKNL